MALDLSALDDFGGSEQAPPSLTAPRASLDQFEEDPDNPRTEFDGPEWASFAADIDERGILQPIVVRQMPNGKLRIRFGHRRYRAAVFNKHKDAPYVVTEDERQFDDYAQVAENEQRKNLQPLELAQFIQKKIGEGQKKKDIAARLHMDPSAITHALALVDAPPFLMELYQSRKCRLPKYLYDLRKLYDEKPDVVETMIDGVEVVDKGLLDAIAANISGKTPAAPAQLAPQAPVVQQQPTSPSPSRDLDGDDADHGKGEQSPGASDKLPETNPATSSTRSPKMAGSDDRFRRPQLIGTYQKREYVLDLHKRPTDDGMIVLRGIDDGHELEAPLTKVALLRLTDAAA